MPGTREDRPDLPDDKADVSGWYRIAGIGIEFIVAVLVLGWAGWYADQKLNTRPWLMIVGGGLGFGAGLWLMVKAARQLF